MLHLLVLLHAGCHRAFVPQGHGGIFHGAVKQNASGSKSAKYQRECEHVCHLPIIDGSAT